MPLPLPATMRPQNWTAAADDVVIVGGGLAGLFTALKLAPRPVTVVSAAPLGEDASTAWAQGGIAAAVADTDSAESHLADTIVAGAGIVDEKIALGMVSEAGSRITDLLGYGVPFDTDLAGRLVLSREAAHSHRRIVRVNGDMAGKAVLGALVAAVRATPSIRVLENHIAEDLVREGRYVAGLHLIDLATQQRLAVPARAVVLATGGIGQIFAVTTNPPHSFGSGLAIAARAGAVLADCEFVQFHPTAFNIGRDPAPLATEALRGEGATLIDGTGRRFMPELHPDAELGPRDVVARGVFAEVAAGRGAFLDCRTAAGGAFKDRFPTVYGYAIEAGIDPVKQPIPVAPAAHYHMGGVFVDAAGRTTVDGLWACGETASTGAHGANRLASNSLLEAVVFAARVAADIASSLPAPKQTRWPEMTALGPVAAVESDDALAGELRALMAAKVGVVRSGDDLLAALTRIRALMAGEHSPRLRNMLTTAAVVTATALMREESRGAHYRTDYPEPRAVWQHRSFTTLTEVNALAARLTG